MLGTLAQIHDLLHRLVCRTVFPHADAVMRENKDHAQTHQRRQPHRRAHVVGKRQKRRRVGNDAAV